MAAVPWAVPRQTAVTPTGHRFNQLMAEPHIASLAPAMLVMETFVHPTICMMMNVVKESFSLSTLAVRHQMPILAATFYFGAVGFALFLSIYIAPPVALLLFKMGTFYFAIFAVYVLAMLPCVSPTRKDIVMGIFAIICNVAAAWLLDFVAASLSAYCAQSTWLSDIITKLVLSSMASRGNAEAHTQSVPDDDEL
eukprot:1589440-Prymnesium_polylepis.1